MGSSQVDDEELIVMKCQAGHSLSYLQMDGVLYPPIPGYSAHLKQLNGYPCRSDDVWIFGYPKSGSHWLWEVVNMVLHNKPEFQTQIMERYLVDFEDLASPDLTRPAPRVLVSHVPCQHAPRSVFNKTGVKIIYIIRNPKDVAVSAYNHLTSVTDHFRQLAFHDFLPLFMDGKVYYGDWYDHVTAWHSLSRGKRNILIVKYEDMKRDLCNEVIQMAEFLEQPISTDMAESIAQACTFSRMKQGKAECMEKWKDDGVIHSVYRKGQVGDWKNWFTPAENEEFDRRHRKRMQEYGGDLNVEFELSPINSVVT